MSRLDDLPPDQRAALSLLLRQRKSYAEVAALLGIAERAVHDRAHAALAVLAPAQARELTAEQREEIGDYLLGQQQRRRRAPGARARCSTARAPARAWAQALARRARAARRRAAARDPAGAPAGRAPAAPPSELAADAARSARAARRRHAADAAAAEPRGRLSAALGALLLGGDRRRRSSSPSC